MKLKLCTALLICSFSVSSAVIMVDNNTGSPVQFDNIQDAVDAATSGDTIMIVGSTTTYPSFTNDSKALHFVGIGHLPDKQVPHPVVVQQAYFTSTTTFPQQSSSGSSIHGIKFLGGNGVGIRISGNPGNQVSSISISRCDISQWIELHYASSVSIRDVICKGVRPQFSSPTYSSITLRNSIIKESIQDMQSSNNSILISNCLFIRNSPTSGTFISASCEGLLFSNNIFYGKTAHSSYENCVFNNNLTFGSSNNNLNLSGTNSGANNIIGQDPQFVSASVPTFNHSDDYNLQSSSPGFEAGTDGTDLGVHGGAFPWVIGGASGSGFMYTQEPRFPQVNLMNILTPTVQEGGNMEIQVRGIKND